MKKKLTFLGLLTLLFSCKENKPVLEIATPVKTGYGLPENNLADAVRYDKILGALVGSAIGDAMGASTEMWHRKDIQRKYGYITGLTPAVRYQSPEGTWGHNLDSGSTTDDTRWKMLLITYLGKYGVSANADHFTTFITDYYSSLIPDKRSAPELMHPDVLDTQIEKLDWIKEWARVAFAYKQDAKEYQKALNRFYGGEMACAGMLYAPVFGLCAANAETAYAIAYDHAIFDIGYAKDISGMTAAITQMALQSADMDSILNASVFVDPYGYQDSRLVGRIAYSIADNAEKNVKAALEILDTQHLFNSDPVGWKMPKGYPGSLDEWVRQESIYRALEKNKKAIPFHAGEIWEIAYTALVFGEGDFEKTLQFIVNYGRDNDTVAAVAGMILGAKVGYANLPKELKEATLQVNRENLGIDLEVLTNTILNLSGSTYTSP
ncbi:ADP-ribosylglycohydrolase family protein [Arenibacter sp. GZD96]|uniref:ADP-ribosylglycohydrolase family protein n=1 Tax=Aurantibrevibacter litoralis TaxID=3106030 RepID=UPI002AFFA946|nr:ADP-ribosylglycohydrolase family protein [Arenibacter sp. GZD-96]MEA1785589.1 ADP-ribosylglycohydrolase family protein [Arenibacter sp. GZD-96]